MNHIIEILAALFPIATPDAELRLFPTEEGGDSRPHNALVHLVLFDRDDDGWGDIRDVKEQALALVPEEHQNHPRLEELLLGWAVAVEDVLSRCTCVETLMPGDFAPDASLFALKRARTAEDYRQACMTRGRLGRWVMA